MMHSDDRLADLLAAFALAPQDALDPRVLTAAEDRLIDSIGVALDATDADGVVAARRYAAQVPGECVVWGSPVRTDMEHAALVNGVATRLLDFNDAYFSAIEGNHPSDLIAALMATAQGRHRSGRELLEAIIVAYEVVVELCDHLAVTAQGWDHVNLTAVAACCGIGRLMGLSQPQLREALSIMAVSHVAANQSRVGELTMWKGFAGADAARHAVYACRLAAAGVAGPRMAFEGSAGFLTNAAHAAADEVIGDINLISDDQARPCIRILDTHLKRWSVAQPLQSAVEAALALRARLSAGAELRAVRVFASARAIAMMVDPQKWKPQTAATADHSLPYLVAAVLLWGEPGEGTFDAAHRNDPRILNLLDDRLTVEEDPSFNGHRDATFPTRLEVETPAQFAEQCVHPPGHAANPLSRTDLLGKVAPMYLRLGRDRAAALTDLLTNLAAVRDIQDLTRYLVTEA